MNHSNKLNEQDHEIILKLYQNHSGKYIADYLNQNSNHERKIKDYQVYGYLKQVKQKMLDEVEKLNHIGLIEEASVLREKLAILVPEKRQRNYLQSVDNAIKAIVSADV